METGLDKSEPDQNALKLLRARELSTFSALGVQKHLQVTEALIKRLGLEFELQGHKGCVNCLQWSTDGRFLASGSDDTRVIIWDPFRHRQLKTVCTPHAGNIFSVKFLGGDSDPLLVTAAGDYHVIVQSVDREPCTAPILNCRCHAGRVKRIAVAPDQPQLFWSAGEDGLILQFDLREQHQCISNSTMFLDLTVHTGWVAEAKCIAVNPTKPHLIAVGANDCFVRMYDRRMVKATPYRMNHHEEYRDRNAPRPEQSLDPNCVQYFAPGHLEKCNGDLRFKLAATYVTFNPSGTELLVNMGGEQIYLYDINSKRHIDEIRVPEESQKNGYNGFKRSSGNSNCCCENSKKKYRRLSFRVKEARQKSCACQYISRASTLFQRKWIGDVYAAARDYLHVIKHWPDNREAYAGLIMCFVELKWYKIASSWVSYFYKLFPGDDTIQLFSVNLDTLPDKTNTTNYESIIDISEQEKQWRKKSIDFETRYVGHCNTTTDIKEANFLGSNGQYIIAGSDDGIFFIWDRKSTNMLRAMLGDSSIVNCVQPHPNTCLIATSGIDTAVKLWSPLAEDGKENSSVVSDPVAAVEANQQRISMDPFETMLANMGFQVRASSPYEALHELPSCRTS